MGSKTLLIITPGSQTWEDSLFTLCVAETGEGLCSHLCSNSSFAYHDLYGARPERQELFKERFGEVKVKFIDQTDITESELRERNEKWWQSIPKDDNGKPIKPSCE